MTPPLLCGAAEAGRGKDCSALGPRTRHRAGMGVALRRGCPLRHALVVMTERNAAQLPARGARTIEAFQARAPSAGLLAQQAPHAVSSPVLQQPPPGHHHSSLSAYSKLWSWE